MYRGHTMITMTRIKARSNFGSTVARAAITRAQLAAAADVSVRTIDSLANPGAAGRSGFAREITAWKIAKGFARLTAQMDETAFNALFEEVEED
jgi:hypothetical protein